MHVKQRHHLSLVSLLLAGLFCFLPLRAAAESIVRLKAQLGDIYGLRGEYSFQMSVWKPVTHRVRTTNGTGNAGLVASSRPVVIFAHGRPGTPHARVHFGRAKPQGLIDWFLARGYVVLVPTRVGYGDSGGPDLDDNGACWNKQYSSALAAGIEQHRQVLAWITQQTDLNPQQIVLVGESHGGLLSIGAAAVLAQESGVRILGSVNVAGGSGGDGFWMRQSPCSAQRLTQAFAEQASAVPSLWMYAQHDLFWGESLPRNWWRVYTQAKGQGTFMQFPMSTGYSGHSLLMAHREPVAAQDVTHYIWQDTVSNFLKSIGL